LKPIYILQTGVDLLDETGDSKNFEPESSGEEE